MLVSRELSNDLKPEELRRVAPDDVPWVLSLAYKRYRSYDPGKTLLWLLNVMRNDRALAIRSENAFVISHITTTAWWPDEPECHVAFTCAAEGHHWEAVRLLRQSIGWAREKGCVRWWFSSETDVDVEALALRVGARPAVMRYLIDLTDDD